MVDLTRDIDIGIGSKRSTAGASRVRRALDSIKNKSRQVHRSGERDAKRHAKSLGFLRTAALAVTGVLAAKSLLRSQIEFGQAISDLSAITGAVGKDLDFLTQKSKEFGETTTLSASQAAEAFRVIASAKPDLLESVDALALVTQEAIVLAEATGDSLPTAANVMASSLNQFSAGADQASRFINVLAAGSKRGAALVGEMGEALKFAGVIASKQAKLGFEETNAALQLLSTFAIKGGEAGSQLRGILLGLTTQSNDAFNPAIVGLGTALDNLAVSELSAGEALKLFQRRNLAAATVLIENRDKLATLTAQLTGTNIAYEQQAIRVDNLSGDLKGLKSAYEGVELTIGRKLNGTLRVLTKSATENLRALARNPLLQERTSQVLDLIHRALEDVRISFEQVKDIVTETGGGAAVFEGIWTEAIQNIVKWTKFLWEQFVIGGPANLKLGFTFMIAAADRFRIFLVEKIRLATFSIILSFQEMANTVGRVFDSLKVTINSAIDAIIGGVQQRLFGLARGLANLGFEERAREVVDLGIAIGKLATFEAAATAEAKKNEDVRKAQIALIDELIRETQERAEIERQASKDAVAGAVAERDATLETIKALRTKRKEIQDGASTTDTGGVSPTKDPLVQLPEDAADAYENLGDVQREVVDSMADGISDMAAQGKLDFASLAASIIQDLIRIQLQASLTSIFANIIGNFGNSASSTSASTGTGGSPVTGLAHGGSFRIGGGGGTDSQVAIIKASPNETISVRTPQQVREEKVSGSPVKVRFVVNNFTDSKVEATQAQDIDGNVLIQASIVAVSQNIVRNGEVFQALQSRNRLQRR